MNKIFATLLLSAFALTGCCPSYSPSVTETTSTQETQPLQRSQPVPSIQTAPNAQQVEHAADVVDLARKKINAAEPAKVVVTTEYSRFSGEYQGRHECKFLGFEVPAREMVRATPIGAYGSNPLPTSIDDPSLLADSTLENALDYVESNNVELLCVGDRSSETANQFYGSMSAVRMADIGGGDEVYNLPFDVVDGNNGFYKNWSRKS
jgi:hypothetical protein